MDKVFHIKSCFKVPKFSIEQRHELSDALVASYPGIAEVFSAAADFSNMAANSAGFRLEKIHHKVRTRALGFQRMLYTYFD